MEWEANHMGDFITSPQNDLFYFLDSMKQELYQELFLVMGKNTGKLCAYVNYKIHCILDMREM